MRFINLSRHRLGVDQIVEVRNMGFNSVTEPSLECKEMCACMGAESADDYLKVAKELIDKLELKQDDVIHIGGELNFINAMNYYGSKLLFRLVTSRMEKENTIDGKYKHKFMGFTEVYSFIG